MNPCILPPEPLSHPGTIRVLLGQEASDAIAANGDQHMACVIYPNAASPPEHHGRLILVCVPTTKERLHDAQRVALGTHKAVRIPTPKA